MWLSRIVALVSVYVILICSTEGKPSIEGLPLNDDDFLNLLVGNGKGSGVKKSELTTCPCEDLGGDDCRCVPFHACSDPRPANIPDNYGCFNNNPILLIDERSKDSPCPPLELCCKCTTGGSPTPDPREPEPKTPKPTPLSQCGKRNPDGVGVTIEGFKDSQTQVGEFPWMVAVLKQDTTYVAGGSLVHPRVILTAGHKVHRRNAVDLMARIGDWDLENTREHPEPQNIDVDRILYHTDFVRSTHENNVALLILKNEVVYNKLVMPICLPKPNQGFDGSNCFVTGWGKKEFGGQYQTILKKIAMPIVGHHQCQTDLRKTRLGSSFTLLGSFVCAGGLGEDACTGDGGSPLVCPDPNNPTEYVQVGVVSWGIGCKTVGNPGVYGSIPKTVDWISRTIKEETVGIDDGLKSDGRG